MGVVGRPIKERNFDGRIHMERVSKIVEVKKMTSHQNICDDVIVNAQIKDGAWENLHYDGMTLDAV